ncbi:hypothetical protein C8R47DRAFT_186433 [Mycena vitilis]|nr:hypothetical protein C8R47DRAFT_186433 [Mycena vitilis]
MKEADFLDLSNRLEINLAFPSTKIRSGPFYRTRSQLLCTYTISGRVPFPENCKGFMYCHTHPRAAPLEGNLLFRLTERRDPASFEDGVDLRLASSLQPDTRPAVERGAHQPGSAACRLRRWFTPRLSASTTLWTTYCTNAGFRRCSLTPSITPDYIRGLAPRWRGGNPRRTTNTLRPGVGPPSTHHQDHRAREMHSRGV